ncbi:MAG: 4-hydroxy-tetrahydrodipicolinate synthase [Lachnospiraceae bacterium]|nr:4-hydroxy-tetrahydrodipicolinate synthase [Lachnospiraceae bacterium]MBO7599601.1 4-hydroxy-tetrahydrodipicolinate synthase [Lachnospiraceae bacterium]
MSTPIFKGAAVALVTPMKADGSVNYEKLDELIEFQISGKTDAIVACGTTGEASTLSHEEHLNVIRHTVKKVAGRVPVIAGTGSNSTETAIYLSVEAEKAGADALLLVTPYYNKATQNGLAEHFVKTAEAVKIPVILYNVPSRTGCNIQPATVKKINERAKNVVAIKEASGDISQVAQLASIMDEDFSIYSGNDDQIVPILSLGGLGVISVLSNIAPKQTHDIVAAYLDGDIRTSCKLQLEAIDIIKSLFCEVNPIPVKTALNLMGMEAGPLRLPLTEMEASNIERLKNSLVNYGIEVAHNQVIKFNDLTKD